MKRYVLIFLSALAFAPCEAFDWWPFGEKEESQPRISQLMKPVNELIDQAEDRKNDGRFSEAVDLYREALNELMNVEYSNPDLVDTPAFSTVKNKRAYVNAAIATLQLREASEANGRVTLSDTTDLEKTIEEQKAAEKEAQRKAEEARREAERKSAAAKAGKAAKDAKAAAKKRAEEQALARRKERVAKVPAEIGALNRFAAKEMSAGEEETAELALKRAIELFPGSHFAYYNLAKLLLSTGASVSEVGDIYRAGRAVGGPVDRALETALKEGEDK